MIASITLPTHSYILIRTSVYTPISTTIHTPRRPLSMKLRAHAPISHSVNPQLKHQPRTLTPHIQCKIQIIKLNPLCRRQPRKQTLRHSIQIRSKCANINQAFLERIRRYVCVTGDEVVFDDQGLTGSEVACVVKGYWVGFGDLCALCWWVLLVSGRIRV